MKVVLDESYHRTILGLPVYMWIGFVSILNVILLVMFGGLVYWWLTDSQFTKDESEYTYSFEEPEQKHEEIMVIQKESPKIRVWSWKGGASVKKEQLRETIKAVINRLPLESTNETMVDLLMETAAVETHRGLYMTQMKNGPARGIYQMEVRTIEDTLAWLKYTNKELYSSVQAFYNKKESEEWNYCHNVPWQTAMAVAYYIRMGKEAINNNNDRESRAAIYKKIWNTYKGATTIEVYYSKSDQFA